MAREVVKNVVIKGKAQTGAIKKSLKEIQSGTSKVGVAANKTKKEMDALAGGIDKTDKAASKAAKSTKEAGISLSSLKTGALAAVAGLTAAIVAVDKLSQKSLELQNVSRNLAVDITQAKAATGGLVDDYTLMKQASAAVSLGVAKNGDEFGKLAEAAVKLGARVGKDASSSVEDLTTALARNSPMILDNLGVTVKQSEANRRYAAMLGKSVEALTEEEKAQAFRQVAMEKVLAVSKDVTLTTDGLAAAIQKSKTAIIDEGNAILGLDASMGQIRERVEKLDEKVLKAAKTMDTFGASRDIVVEALRAQGIGAENTARAFEVLRQKIHATKMTAMDYAEQEGRRIRDEQLTEINTRIKDREREIKLIEAMGGKTKLVRQQVQELKRAIASDKSYLAEKAMDFDKAEQIQFDAQLEDIQATASSGGGGGGKKKDKFALGDHRYNRRIDRSDFTDIGEAAVEQEKQMLEKRREAGIEFTEAMIEQEIKRAKFEEQAHRQRVAQMKAEEKARKEALRERKEAAAAVGNAMMEAANTANAAAELGLIGEKRAAGISIWAGGLRLAWRASELGAEAIGNIASQNYVKGGAQLVASAALAAQAGAHFGKAASLGGGGSDGLGVGRTPGISPGVASAMGGGGGPGDAPTLGGSADRPGIPTSRPSDVPPPSPANGPPPSGGNTYVFQGNLIAGSEEELGLKLREIEKNTAQRFGT